MSLKTSCFSLILSFLLFSPPAFSQILPKSVDGTFTDWNASDFSIDDAGDSSELDILKVSVSNDDMRLFLLIETNDEFDMQDDEDITVFIDADNNPNTGFPRNGIGAEFTYYYGARQGFINQADGSSTQTNHNGLGAMSSPTVTSDKFELVLDRSVSDNGFSATMGSTISILIENDGSGDLVPNTSGGFQYTLSTNPTFQSQYNIDKDPSHTRFMSYNVLQDGITSPDREEEFEKILDALNPDIIAFQEVYNSTTNDISDLLTTLHPLPSGQSWQVAKSNPDIILATRYDIEAWDDIDGNAVFLVYDDNEEPILIYNVHLPCCANDDQRQEEIDKLLSVIRDKESSPLTGFSYPENAPLIITGDFNMVGLKQNYDSFIEGDIFDNNTYGQDFAPDWDGSVLEDANPSVTGYPGNYTWNNPNGSYHPGKLDLLFYTGSVMQQQNAFVLDTEYLSDIELNNYNLATNTTTLASDHLPLVVDFTLGIEQLEDLDGDTYTSDFDCDDNNPAINPDADEICNGIDDNCNGLIDDQDPNLLTSSIWYQDNDGDGFGNPLMSILACNMPIGYSANNTDCNDNNMNINPNHPEVCDNLDNNCNGTIDEGIAITTFYIDVDMDGFGDDNNTVMSCFQPLGYVSIGGDCDDNNIEINPNAVDIPDNGIDENCDGQDASIEVIVDADGDGYSEDEDCNDNDPNINPGAMEICDGMDNNCDGEIDEGFTLTTYYQDNDMDGFGDDNSSLEDCIQPIGYVSEGGDCNDASANIYPGAPEICDQDDNNCNGEIDEGLSFVTYYADTDMDGFGNDDSSFESCVQPPDSTTEGGDCDDSDPNVYPGAPEILDNEIDEDCDGSDLSDIHEIQGIKFNIYPNPTNENLFIDVDEDIAYHVSLINANGSKMLTPKKIQGRGYLDLRELPKGLYILIITGTTQDFRLTDRIVIF